MIGSLLVILSCAFTSTARADIFGGDDAILADILQEAVQQYSALTQIVSTGQGTEQILLNANAGIGESLALLHSMFPRIDPGIYQKYDKIKDILGQLKSIYGEATQSGEFVTQNDTDKEVAEAINLNNKVYDYSNELDAVGEQIKKYSNDASPGRAQKLTAQALGALIHAQSASNRIQGASLKLQAQALEIQNHKDKESTKIAVATSGQLEKDMAESQMTFSFPRFE